MEAATSQPGIATTPLEVRDRLVEALELDLVGPGPGHPLAEEQLPGWERPSNWYLTGFLTPVRSAEEEAGDVDSDEEVDEPQEDDPSDDGAEDRTAAKRRYFPSSLGLSDARGRRRGGHQRDGPMGRLHRRRARSRGERRVGQREPKPAAARVAAKSAGAGDRGAAERQLFGSAREPCARLGRA